MASLLLLTSACAVLGGTAAGWHRRGIPLANSTLMMDAAVTSAGKRPSPTLAAAVAEFAEAKCLIAAALLAAFVTALVLCCNFDQWCVLLPLSLQRQVTLICWIACLTPILTIGAWMVTLAIAWNDPQKNLLCISGATIGCLLGWSGFRATFEVSDSLFDRRTDDGIILQSSSVSCAAACLANVSCLNGNSMTEREAAALLRTTNLGTGDGQIRFALTDLQIPFYEHRTVQPVIENVRPPAILSVDHPATGRESHAVLLRAIHSDRPDAPIEIWDPLVGRCFFTRKELAAFWHGMATECHIRSAVN